MKEPLKISLNSIILYFNKQYLVNWRFRLKRTCFSLNDNNFQRRSQNWKSILHRGNKENKREEIKETKGRRAICLWRSLSKWRSYKLIKNIKTWIKTTKMDISWSKRNSTTCKILALLTLFWWFKYFYYLWRKKWQSEINQK